MLQVRLCFGANHPLFGSGKDFSAATSLFPALRTSCRELRKVILLQINIFLLQINLCRALEKGFLPQINTFLLQIIICLLQINTFLLQIKAFLLHIIAFLLQINTFLTRIALAGISND